MYSEYWYYSNSTVLQYVTSTGTYYTVSESLLVRGSYCECTGLRYSVLVHRTVPWSGVYRILSNAQYQYGTVVLYCRLACCSISHYIVLIVVAEVTHFSHDSRVTSHVLLLASTGTAVEHWYSCTRRTLSRCTDLTIVVGSILVLLCRTTTSTGTVGVLLCIN